MKYKTAIIFISVLFILLGAGCGAGDVGEKKLSTPYEKSHFGFMQGDNRQEIKNLNVHWQRPTLEFFTWNIIEPEKGKYNWKIQDDTVSFVQQYDINMVADIQPYANWDQKKCRKKFFEDGPPGMPSYGAYRQKPCSMDDYKNFVAKLVERYDGDGYNDMPGLKIPIKYWEVMNEVSAQGEDADNTFKGTAQEYAEILKATYQAVKQADPEAKVLQGGIPGLFPKQIEFWDIVMKHGGKNYFDIANIHAVRTRTDAFYAKKFKAYLTERGINKPFWITEAQLNSESIGGKKLTNEEWAKFMLKNFVRAFAYGADKVFYVGLERSPADPGAWLIKDSKKQEAYYAFKTLVEKLDFFSSVEKLSEGQYKFLVNNQWVYVVWNNIPKEITGKVKATYWNGKEEVLLNASQIDITKSPVFIEKI